MISVTPQLTKAMRLHTEWVLAYKLPLVAACCRSLYGDTCKEAVLIPNYQYISVFQKVSTGDDIDKPVATEDRLFQFLGEKIGKKKRPTIIYFSILNSKLFFSFLCFSFVIYCICCIRYGLLLLLLLLVYHKKENVIHLTSCAERKKSISFFVL